MRLLNTHTGHFVEFHDIANVRYAILSHTWDACGEQTYRDVREIQRDYPIQAHASTAALDPLLPETSNWAEPVSDLWIDGKLSEKIRKACEIARSHGYCYMWIDSCCIDKTSSSELSEAINSMYAWYGRAAICYAFLADVPQDDDPDSDQSAFRKSRWFRRGWTLQELIAPKRLIFLSLDWQALGSKTSMAGLVEQITRIERKVLTNQLSLDKISVARRMSWAAERETTRVEDCAYSLLGIFDLNMPTLYGEGERAFRRLQEEILRRVPDQTLFALNKHPTWSKLPLHDQSHSGYVRPQPLGQKDFSIQISDTQSFLSSSPSDFNCAGSVDTMPERDYLHLLGLSEIPYPDYSPSPYGMHSSFPMIPIQRCFRPIYPMSMTDEVTREWYLVLLRCHSSSQLQNFGPHLLARICRVTLSPPSKIAVMTGSTAFDSFAPAGTAFALTLFIVTADQLRSLCQHVQVRSVYLPHPDRVSPTSPHILIPSNRDFTLALSSYTSTILGANGHDTEFRMLPQTVEYLQTHSLIVRMHDHVLQVNIDEFRGPISRMLSTAAWSFSATDAQGYSFPLLTSMDPPPHDAVIYYSFGAGQFRSMDLPMGAIDVTVRLELENALSVDSSVSHYLHVDIEEQRRRAQESESRGASTVMKIRKLWTQICKEVGSV